jgi:glycosyltransferase involved in cell wall biosynthesis
MTKTAQSDSAMQAEEYRGGGTSMSGDTQRLKLLLIASGCDGMDVGESWNSFQWASRLRQRHDVTLLTFRHRDRPSTVPQLPGVRVIEWLDLPFVGRWERFNSMLKPGYISFYMRARRWIKNRLRSGEKFDVAHQVTPASLRYPSPASGLGIPLLIGPVGGGLDNPGGFESELRSAPWYTKLRLLDEWRLRHDPLLRRSFASANCILCVTPNVKSLLGDLPSHEVELMSDNGVAELPPPRSHARENKKQLRMLFVGRMIRTKGARDAIRAIAKLKDIEGLTFDVIGDGYDLPACKEEAQKLGVSNVVTFHGRMPRKDIDAFYARADVFLFPSFREPGGIAVFEAMSHGLAMIVADRGGPGFVVDDACGIRIPVTDPEQFATRIADAIRKLAAAPELVAAMGTAAREKIRLQFLWDMKIERIGEIYHRVSADYATANSRVS